MAPHDAPFKLEHIGFYTLDDRRAMEVSMTSPLWRCELILTDICNFKCPYCRGIEEEHCGSMSWADAAFVVDMWASQGLRNVRFSGGEPTLWKAYETLEDGSKVRRSLLDLVARAKAKGIQRIAISTNGSVDTKFYRKLVAAGTNDFSISLDACCAETGDKMAGSKPGAWHKVVNNIRELAKLTYVTVGVVFTEENVHEFNEVVKFASGLGVADIRILSSAQWNETFRDVRIDQAYLDRHPILRYRMQNFNDGQHVRGLTPGDNPQCPLMLDDMAILNGWHYPCIIYLREQGQAIGRIDASLSPEEAMRKVRAERLEWITRTNTLEDPICRKNCLDVCVHYNNQVRALNPGALPAPATTRRVIPIQAI